MKFLILFFFIIISYFSGFSQAKPMLIDSGAYQEWSSVEQASISNNGKFASFLIRNVPLGSCTMVIKKTEGDWEIRLPGVKNISFTSDGEKALFIKSNDSLCDILLGSSLINFISSAESFELHKRRNKEWLTFRNSRDSSFVAIDILTGRKYSYAGVNNFSFSWTGEALILLMDEQIRGILRHTLKWIDLKSGQSHSVFSGVGEISFIMSEGNSQLAYLVSDTTMGNKTLNLYDDRIRTSNILVNGTSPEFKDRFEISSLSKFDNENIFFKVRKRARKVNDEGSQSIVKIWSYLDLKLQSVQKKEIDNVPEYDAAINIYTHRFIPINNDNEYLINSNYNKNFFLISHSGGGDPWELWNDSSKSVYYLLFLRDNRRVNLEINGSELIWMSPEGKYIIYYNSKIGDYFSYEVSTGVKRNITSGLNVSFISSYLSDGSPRARGLGGWLKGDAFVLIYDRFDIWKVDPSGRKRSINLTNGYGLKNNVILYSALKEKDKSVYSEGDTMIINGLSIDTKQNGFFAVTFRESGKLVQLSMGDYAYNLIDNPYVQGTTGMYPLKSKDRKRYVVMRMSASESPNYFFTTDFISFEPLSAVYPEKKYNWVKSELHSWYQKDGRSLQGVLYKPQNFDSLRKYPVIIHYYEKKSYGLNTYIIPEDLTSGCDINIPTYVSNGYLVFTPDINYTIGDPMSGTYNSVVSAAEYLAELPFVNKDRLGIGGCSFGGIQTNYLITHTNIFKAAYSASSMSDLVSAYGGLFDNSISMQCYFEYGGQGRMPGPLSQFPDVYIKSSAIFNVNKVETPVLIMHTTKDPVCSFSQAVEFFTALRRLGKKAWMLEYTDGAHGISGNSAKDFNIRLNQFFDHYLKGLPAPIWMTKTTSGNMGASDSGLNLDRKTATPGKGLLND